MGNYQGKWSAICGYLDEDKPIRSKILEELNEEVGLGEEEIEDIFVREPSEIVDRKIGKIWIVFPVLVILKERAEIKLDWEHTEYKWIKPSEILKYDIGVDLDKTLDKTLGKALS